MPRKGNKRKKTRTHVNEDEVRRAQSVLNDGTHKAANNIPQSAVFKRGKVVPEVNELVSDLREMMRPYTALNLKDMKLGKKSASLTEYSRQLAGPLGVTHLIALNQNPSSNKINMRIARTPAGPTLMFNVKQFSLSRQIKAIQRRPFSLGGNNKAMSHPPVVVTNNFGDENAAPHIKLMRITFQKMFPAVNVATVKLHDIRRVVMFHLVNTDNGDGEVIEVRQYGIRAAPVGVDRKVRRVIRAKGNKIPDLSKLDDIADFIDRSGDPTHSKSASLGDLSESEAEDETTHVVLSQNYVGKGNIKSQKSALKLVELGPRLSLKLVKVERGLSSESDVMYHAFEKKTQAEVKALKDQKEKERALKKKRRQEQEANVAAKKSAMEEKKEAKKIRRAQREREALESLKSEGSLKPVNNENFSLEEGEGTDTSEFDQWG